MTRQEHFMTVSMEECAEVSQRISKAQRFGLEQVQKAKDDRPEQNPELLTNRQRILEEFWDLVAAMDKAGLLDYDISAQAVHVPLEAVVAKQAKMEHYLKMSWEQGTLTKTNVEGLQFTVENLRAHGQDWGHDAVSERE